MINLCDSCGNTACMLQSGIPRSHCMFHIPVQSLEDYIRWVVDEALKKKGEEKEEPEKDPNYVWIVSYVNNLVGAVAKAFNNEDAASKYCSWVRNHSGYNPRVIKSRVYNDFHEVLTDDPR